MANKTVRLTKTVNTANGWRHCNVVLHKNDSISHCQFAGAKYPANSPGQFRLKYYVGSKTVYEPLGADPKYAVDQYRLRQIQLANPNLPLVAQTPVESRSGRLKDAAARFMYEKKQESTRRDTGDLYRVTIDEFLATTRREYPEQVTKIDLFRYRNYLIDAKGLSQRTAANRVGALLTFLRYVGINTEELLDRKAKATLTSYVPKQVETYKEEEIRKLIASSRRLYHKIVWLFLWLTGFRLQEVAYLTWDNIDFDSNTVEVTAKPGFTPKGKQGRLVPLEPELRTALTEWHNVTGDRRYVFGTRSDLPNDKLLYALKRIARRAGLNCGKCRGCIRNRCCERFYLHKFRATHATMLLRNGLDARSVQYLLGNKDLQTTLHYLEEAKGDELQMRVRAAWARAKAVACQGQVAQFRSPIPT